MKKNNDKVLSICFLTEYWERYGFYITQGLIALLIIHVFNFTERNSFLLTGTFVGLVYTSSIIGGIIADKFIGHFRSILLGEFILILGYFILGYGISTISQPFLYLSLALIATGTGLVKSNVSSFLGCFYEIDNPKRDLDFSIFYVGINLGGLTGGFLTGYLNEFFGWSIPFYSAAIGSCIGLVTMWYKTKRHKLDFEKQNKDYTRFLNITISIFISLLTTLFCMYILYSPNASDTLFILITIICIVLLMTTARKYPNHKKSCTAYLILLFISIIFWALFFQLFTSFVILTEKLVNHHVFGFNIPTASIVTMESLGVVLLGGIVGKIWHIMTLKGKDVHDANKFAIAMLIMTIAFAVFSLILSTHNPAFLISGYLIMFIYFNVALAELSLSPIGLSISNKLAPPNSRGLFMGLWLISLGIGGKLSGELAIFATIPTHITR